MKRNEKQMVIVCHQRPDAFASIHQELFDVISPKCLPREILCRVQELQWILSEQWFMRIDNYITIYN